VQCENVMLYG